MKIDQYIKNIELQKKNVEINRRIRIATEETELSMLDDFERILREIKKEQENEND